MRLLGERLSVLPAILRALHGRMSASLSPDELTEVSQESLAVLWSKLTTFDGRVRIEAWAYGFCAVQLIKFVERRQRRSRLRIGLEEGELHQAAPEVPTKMEFEYVHRALERLGPPGNEIVHLKHFEELTFDEIGSRLSISPNTAKTLYYRSVRKLRDSLRPIWNDTEEEVRG